jgi:hypothetical protein
MNITLLHIEECPNWVEAGERLATALSATGHGGEQVDFVLLNTPGEASQYPFAGSPTILIDGVDLFPGAETTTSLACRVYRTGARLAGSPTEAQIVEALRDLPVPA